MKKLTKKLVISSSIFVSMNLMSTHVAHASYWSAFYLNSDACKVLYAYINGSWVRQPTINYMTSDKSRNYWCVYNNTSIVIKAASWNAVYYIGAVGTTLRADNYQINNNINGAYWPWYYYKFMGLSNAWNINNTQYPEGYHLLTEKETQDGSYAFSYDKDWMGMNLRASTVMIGGSYKDAPSIYFQVTGDGNANEDLAKQPGVYLPAINNAPPSKH